MLDKRAIVELVYMVFNSRIATENNHIHAAMHSHTCLEGLRFWYDQLQDGADETANHEENPWIDEKSIK